jgi:hypothetical protein
LSDCLTLSALIALPHFLTYPFSSSRVVFISTDSPTKPLSMPYMIASRSVLRHFFPSQTTSLFVPLTPYSIRNWKLAVHWDIWERICKKYFKIFRTLIIYIHKEFHLNFKYLIWKFKIAPKNLNYIFSHCSCAVIYKVSNPYII